MTDDPFERAVRRAEASERAEQLDDVRRRAVGPWSKFNNTAFRIHASVFVAVNLLLLVIWLGTTPGGYPWPLFVFFGWGIGVVAHYAAVKEHVDRGRRRR